jgi:hypothetical protein
MVAANPNATDEILQLVMLRAADARSLLGFAPTSGNSETTLRHGEPDAYVFAEVAKYSRATPEMLVDIGALHLRRHPPRLGRESVRAICGSTGQCDLRRYRRESSAHLCLFLFYSSLTRCTSICSAPGGRQERREADVHCHD